jgi:SAM-dependent methyltransferase
VLNPDARVADFGVGSGRWASLVAPQVGSLQCVDASREALDVARRNLAAFGNCEFHHATLDDMAIETDSLDFAYSLGVLHHIPDTRSAMRSCVQRLKPGAMFLVYLYYRFDNRPAWYGALWRVSEFVRAIVSRAPHGPRYVLSQILAATVYWPLARGARAIELMGGRADHLPLAYYRTKPFYVMRTDALDRFGTRLEQRFTRTEIRAMMEASGLRDIQFSDSPPFWCAIGRKGA